MKKKIALLQMIFLFAMPALHAEDSSLPSEKHRIDIEGGFLFSQVRPPILNEAHDSWLINSLVQQSLDQSEFMPIPLGKNPLNTIYGIAGSIQYTYQDRYGLELDNRTFSRKFLRSENTASMFFSVPGNTHTWAIFEGSRLMKYKVDQNILTASYTFLRGKKIRPGISLNYESYREINDMSMGSYQRQSANSPQAGVTTWAFAGDGEALYTMRGMYPGFFVKWNPLNWLEFHYLLQPLQRSGSFKFSGHQKVRDELDGAIQDYGINFFAFQGDAKDQGTRHTLESSIRFGMLNSTKFGKYANFDNFYVTAGLVHVNVKRSYGSYIGDYAGSLRNVSVKTRLVGLGELSSSFSGVRNDIYVKLGYTARLGNLSESASSTQTEEKKAQEKPTKKESVADLKKTSTMLNQTYDSIKENFEQSGLPLERAGDGLKGAGFSMERELDNNRNTRKVRIAFDGDMSFPVGTSTLTPAADKVIAQIGKAMTQYPDTVVSIYGHTDSTGSKEGNYYLSNERAKAVRTGLMKSYNISANRFIEVKGLADERKIVPTMGNEPRNRRVEILVTGQES